MRRCKRIDVRRTRARRAKARASASGFTLIELLVVVVLVGILTALAIPAMSTARADRLVFNYARQAQAILHRARVRAAGTGSAHLVLLDSTGRGTVRLFQALDGSAPAAPLPPGPLPVSSCKLANEWNAAAAWTVGSTSKTAPLIEGIDMNGTGVLADVDVKSRLLLNGTAATVAAFCVTPGGITYVGTGGDATGAIAAMRNQTLFTGVLEMDIERHEGGVVAGLTRRVLVAGGGAPRLKSQ